MLRKNFIHARTILLMDIGFLLFFIVVSLASIFIPISFPTTQTCTVGNKSLEHFSEHSSIKNKYSLDTDCGRFILKNTVVVQHDDLSDTFGRIEDQVKYEITYSSVESSIPFKTPAVIDIKKS